MAAASVGLVAVREEPYNSTHNKVQNELNRQGAKNAKKDIRVILGVLCVLAVIKICYPEFRMEKEYIDRARAIREGILQLRDSL